MEESTFIPANPDQSTQPHLTQKSIGYLLTAAKWGKFLAILGFITIAFAVLAGLLMGFFLSVIGPVDVRYDGSAALGFLGLIGAGLGVLAGGIIAVLLDKRP